MPAYPKVGKRIRSTRTVWGIQMRSARETWGGPLGVAWLVPDIGTLLRGVPRWPAQFRTRAEARAMAHAVDTKYRYLGPHHGWRFRPVRLEITVRER